MAQLLLLPDPRPLDRRLGKRFFRDAPRGPGVYLMRDAHDHIVYVGKGKDLKRRIGNYRVANPDQMPRRHLRMVNEVSRIEFRVCPSESAALETEAKLIRTLKPKFNRAGVWPGKTRFIVWRAEGDRLEIAVAETPEPGWQRFGPMGSSAFAVHHTITLLIWLAVHPERDVTALPAGWMSARFPEIPRIPCGEAMAELLNHLQLFFFADAPQLVEWFGGRLASRTNRFERGVIGAGIESLKTFSHQQRQRGLNSRQLALL